MNIDRLKADLERDEGVVEHAYQDHLGYWTIGVGRLIDKRRGGGLSHDEMVYLLGNDIDRKTAEMDRRMPWWRDLDPVRARGLVNMAFNLGVAGVLNFRNMCAALRSGDWQRAHDEALNSLWARQVGQRSQRIADMFLTGGDA